jgi:hypothetical protein
MIRLSILTAILFLLLVAAAATQSRYRTTDAYCRSVVGNSWSLMETCLRMESEAQRNLNNRRVDSGIWAYCQRIVPDSWSLMETCVNQEEQARGRVKQCLYSALCR